MRERALAHHGEAEATVVVVQGDSKKGLHLFGKPYAVARGRAAMFHAAVSWREFDLAVYGKT